MSGAPEAGAEVATPAPGPLEPVERALALVNRGIERLGAVALVTAASILTYSVVSRYLFKANTDWQDEAAVFCIVGAVFLACASVQSHRGHVGIEALASILPQKVNHVRLYLVDIASFLFCAFFAWKSWTLFHEAWVDNQTTTSTWAPPLWIPYSLMAVGVTLLAVQIAVQLGARATRHPEAA